MNKHKLVYIEWEDAFSNGKWLNKNEFDEWQEGNYIVKQVGFIYSETSKHLVLFAQYNNTEDGYAAQYGQTIKIPKPWIRKRINLTKYIK